MHHKRSGGMRGQTSIEFLILFGFMLIVFLSFFVIIQQYVTSSHANHIQNALVEVAQVVEEELLLANQVNPIYKRQINLPATIVEQIYSVYIVDNTELILNTTNYEYLIFLPFNVSTVPDGSFIVSQNVIIKNDSGIYVITS